MPPVPSNPVPVRLRLMTLVVRGERLAHRARSLTWPDQNVGGELLARVERELGKGSGDDEAPMLRATGTYAGPPYGVQLGLRGSTQRPSDDGL